ncbi:group II intron reverse transcriptase/maturase [Ferrimonas futtsuensis]|uniref:group II intron reverse transcriptase/maturase n=1 Tax=Ferrimonas futtsuensis TaxID=364764 RepID=UPI0004261966|nr:group II intron reverse transcriptase/maturase [Ferrimonas futtsuensis]
MTTELQAIAFKARTHPKHRFQDLYGLLEPELLYTSWGQLNKHAAPGVDGARFPEYQQNLVQNITRLSAELKTKRYRTKPIKRVFIPKSNGKQRPLGLPTIDDKLVQQSVSQILQSIWESDFLPFSYGYRPNKSAHQAVESLNQNLFRGRFGYIVEADIKGFFDNMSHDWLHKMLLQRVDDKALLSTIKQWLKAKIKSPEGRCVKSRSGTPQGGVISPILANIYLHYVVDIWFEKVVKPRLRGDAMLIRYADDFVCAFQHQQDAEAFYRVLPKRLKRFDLEVAEEKTKIIRFNRYSPGRDKKFQFLGFEFLWELNAKGKACLRRRTAPKKQKATLTEFYRWIKFSRFKRLGEWLPSLKRKLTGFGNYFGLPDNSRSLTGLYKHVIDSLYKWLNRRSQRRSYNWAGLKQMLMCFGIRGMRVRRRSNVKVDWYLGACITRAYV